MLRCQCIVSLAGNSTFILFFSPAFIMASLRAEFVATPPAMAILSTFFILQAFIALCLQEIHLQRIFEKKQQHQLHLFLHVSFPFYLNNLKLLILFH